MVYFGSHSGGASSGRTSNCRMSGSRPSSLAMALSGSLRSPLVSRARMPTSGRFNFRAWMIGTTPLAVLPEPVRPSISHPRQKIRFAPPHPAQDEDVLSVLGLVGCKGQEGEPCRCRGQRERPYLMI